MTLYSARLCDKNLLVKIHALANYTFLIHKGKVPGKLGEFFEVTIAVEREAPKVSFN